MSEFRVGDRVRVKNHLTAYKGVEGKIVTVRTFLGSEPNLDVQLDGYDIPHTFIADELAPADAPEPSADDVRVEAIRERVAGVFFGKESNPQYKDSLFYKGTRQSTHLDVVITQGDVYRTGRNELYIGNTEVSFLTHQQALANECRDFIYQSPDYIRYLLERLDAVTKERNELRARLNADMKESDDADAG